MASTIRTNQLSKKKRYVRIGKSLANSDISYLSNITGFTPQQVHDWHNGFLKDCPCGRLGKKQFINVYKQFYPTGRPEKFSGYVFRVFDLDGSGDINFREFLIAISIGAQQDRKKKLEWAFSLYDLNRDGFIDKKEMQKVMHAIYDLRGVKKSGSNSPDIKVNQIFSKMDCNGDQKLSQEEFVSGCLQDRYLQKLLAPSAS